MGSRINSPHYLGGYWTLQIRLLWGSSPTLNPTECSVYRPHLTDGLLDDEKLCQILARLRVPPGMVDEVRRWAAGLPLLSDLSEHHIAYVRALFRAPTFVLAGHPCHHRSQAGTRPGDSIADVLFAMVMSDAMRSCVLGCGQRVCSWDRRQPLGAAIVGR